MPTTTVAPIPLDLLEDIGRGLARSPSLWRPHAHHLVDRRRPVRLLATDHYEAWVIGWTGGQGVELHDHGDSVGSLTVVEGEVEELVPAGGRLRGRRLTAGRTVVLPAGLVHDVVAPGPAPATSVHVYSPPLRHMSFYAADGRRLRTEQVVPEPPVVAPDRA